MSRTFDEIMERFSEQNVARSFLVTGNVADSIGKRRSVVDGLMAEFGEQLPIIARFSLVRGWENVGAGVDQLRRLLEAENILRDYLRRAGKPEETFPFGFFGPDAASRAPTAPEELMAYIAAVVAAINKTGPQAVEQGDDDWPFTKFEGLQDIEIGQLPTSVTGVVSLVNQLIQLRRQYFGSTASAWVLEQSDMMFPPTPVEQMSEEARKALSVVAEWASRPAREASINLVILTAEDAQDLHPVIQKAGFSQIVVERPDEKTRRYLVEAGCKQFGLTPNGLLEPLVKITSNLTWKQIVQILQASRAAGELTLDGAAQMKRDMITAEFAGIIEIVNPIPEKYMRGAHIPKRILREIADRILAGDPTAPFGVLLAGPPGTGKTRLVQVLGDRIGIPVVKFNPDAAQDQFVGQSGKKMRKALAFIRQLAPCVVFIDEIDQTVAAKRDTGGNGNPVAAELFGEMIKWMSDPSLKGLVLLVMATNRPDLLDDAFKRNGRVDEVIPYPAPTLEEKFEIIPAICEEDERVVEEAGMTWLAKNSRDYTPADLRAVIKKAAEFARREGAPAATLPHVAKAVRFLRPDGPRNVRYMDYLMGSIKDLETLPPEYWPQGVEVVESAGFSQAIKRPENEEFSL